MKFVKNNVFAKCSNFNLSFIKTYSSKIDWLKFLSDMTFMALSGVCFYSNLFVSLILMGFVLLLAGKTNRYHKSLERFYLNHFVDFLNQINSNLCIGMGFDASITTSAALLNADTSYSSQAIHQLNNAIKMGIKSSELFNKIQDLFPISEAILFCNMMQSSKETGASPSEITGITIDKLYLKFKINDEIETILYQKKLEQSILCLAPMFIILFIKLSSPKYLDAMYQTVFGTIWMSISFMLIAVMKVVSEHIVQLKI